ncbi:uncharacterized protein EKO05_0005424 [Ascochyta rabiei]|uniref:DNA binding n=1 Tax=Didymella rabiei TaxID=5454 RepID=A0A163JPS6_DIDRA|nr:uncharacterized protein EKO05_0005424 [Ascochyta rabiei]KZM26499.1 DNA binding [Ascochyta rabiei]UPX14955.1 hypothetical protein EKO05_0005424 [Ascochyta rabiei]
MGLPELWDTIRDFEEVKPIAQLAEDHYREHGRPLKIAVDEADWRFNNLTMAQVYAIRDSSNEPAFQGIEKAMFYRICKLSTLNIQLLFVFDGPGVPAKRGRNGGRKIDYERLRLLKQLLRCFGIPYQEAPGEAEAECARLQILGIVDAVWSQDSDCLMFGCSLWLHDDRVAKEPGTKDRSKENTKKSDRRVRIVRAKDLKDRLNLDREGLVLFAMLVGGDYHPTGLRDCGAGIALAAVKEGNLAQALCLCRNQRDCTEWSFQLAAFLQTRRQARNLPIPSNFPGFKILQKYYRPKVTSDELLTGNKSLSLVTSRAIDERKLLDVTSSRFNIWGRLYMNWVGPVLLTRSLSKRSTSLPREVVHDIKLTKQRASKNQEIMSLRSFERKITFSPFEVTSLRREDFEGGDREGMWEGKRDMPFNPTHRVECDYFPAFWLDRVLPQGILDPPPSAPKEKPSKRKGQPDLDDWDTVSPSSTNKKQKPQSSNQVVLATPHLAPTSESTLSRLPIDPVRRLKPQVPKRGSTSKKNNTFARSSPSTPLVQRQPTTKPCEVFDLSNLDDNVVLRLPPSRQAEKLSSLPTSLSNVVDLGSPESSADESEDLAWAMRLSMQSSHQESKPLPDNMIARDIDTPPKLSHIQKVTSPPRPVSAAKAIPCETDKEARGTSTRFLPIPDKLDSIRAARLKHFVSSPVAIHQQVVPNRETAAASRVGASVDCIDLTGD